MNLKKTIRRILREEVKIDVIILEDDLSQKKDMSSIIHKLLNNLLVKDYPDIICGVEVFSPQNRKKIQFGTHTTYRVNIIFIGGPNTKFWPRTMSVDDRYSELANKAQDIILSWLGELVEVFAVYTPNCDKDT